MELNAEWVSIGLLVVLSVINTWKQFAKEKGTQDESQNIEITAIKEKIVALENRVSTLEGGQKILDSKLAKEIEKLEKKIDKVTDLLLELIRK